MSARAVFIAVGVALAVAAGRAYGGGVLLILLCALVWLATRGGGGRPAPVRAHVHATGDMKLAAQHEGGHGAVGKHVGGRIGEARIFPDGSGWIEVDHPRGREFTPAEEIAISLAGAKAEGASIRSRQCRGDKANVDEVLRRVPSQNRAAVMAEAKRLTRSGLFWRSGTASRITRDLIERGQR